MQHTLNTDQKESSFTLYLSSISFPKELCKTFHKRNKPENVMTLVGGAKPQVCLRFFE